MTMTPAHRASQTVQSLAAGFTHPVFGAQAAFRAVMRAMAQPGQIQELDKAQDQALEPPLPLNPAAAAACLALADFEASLWLSPTLAAAQGVAEYLRFHCGAPLLQAPDKAAFAVIDIRADALDLAAFAQGTAEYPDQGATLILICEAFPQTPQLTISGPGLRGTGTFGFAPLPTGFTAQWQRNREAFPLGVDLIVTAGNQLACLPRSARILAEVA
jgi:alpha-D-ribose 1-methylphosphonate 5-triphosphate synthase subunit PhnH